MKSEAMHIGVDVSKEKLDVYNPQADKVITVPNSAEGFRQIRTLARQSHAVVCCEPTAGYELEMILFLQKFKVTVAYCDGFRVRHYALSLGQLSKNDRIDARMISRFADNSEIRVIREKDGDQMALRARWKLYKTLVDIHTQLAQKAAAEPDEQIKSLLRTESVRLRRKADKILEKCVELAEADKRTGYLFKRFTEIDGVAARTALAVIAGVPEIGTISDGALAKLVGVAPLDRQSGKTDRTKKIFGGRKDVRNCLYMAAIPTIRSNRILGPYYEQVKKRAPGPRAAKWAVVPVLRKLLFLMNRLARDPSFELQKKPQFKAA